MTTGTKPLVLVADDDRDILELVAFRLERAGYDVVTAHDGAEALNVAEQRAPDLAVLDVMMPRLDGYEVTRRLRADEATQAMVIIILTASVRDTELERAFDAGANDFLRKPFSPADLATRVRAALESAARL
jgi:CheY-like chemotaxis protein